VSNAAVYSEVSGIKLSNFYITTQLYITTESTKKMELSQFLETID